VHAFINGKSGDRRDCRRVASFFNVFKVFNYFPRSVRSSDEIFAEITNRYGDLRGDFRVGLAYLTRIFMPLDGHLSLIKKLRSCWPDQARDKPWH
jgi:hypothetical protein